MRCEIIVTPEPMDRFAFNSPMTEVAHCVTHNMPLGSQSSGRCPIGKIEDATEIALVEIRAAYDERLHECTNWLRRQANAELEPKARAAFIEAHNALAKILRRMPTVVLSVTVENDAAHR